MCGLRTITSSNNIMLPRYCVLHKGSVLPLRAHGRVGASATLSPLSKKSVCCFQRTDKKEGGMGEGIFVRPLRAVGAAGWERHRSPTGAANQKLFRFLLEKCHPPILKIKKNALVCATALAVSGAAGWDGLGFCSSQALAWVIMVEGSNIFQNRPPRLIFRLACAAGKARAVGFGGHFPEIIPRFLPLNRELPRSDAAVFNEIFKLSVLAESI